VPFTPPGTQLRSIEIDVPDTETVTFLLDRLQISQPKMHMISIMKRRRKKMNKHKWKKARRAVRNSSRYNKEKNRKAGTLRKKQE
jgi:hypothetical protein